MEALRVTSLSKYFQNGEQELRVLDGINFGVERGEFLAIIGASGSGKSTLLNLIGGLDHPTSGCVYIDGFSLSAFTEEELTEFRREHIGFIFQNYNLIPVLSGYENIILPAQLNESEIDENFLRKIVTELGIEEKLNQMPGKMSGGEQQRIAIARALYTKPAIILADEPTGNLDSKTSAEVMRLLRRMNRRFHQTMIVVTHDNRIAKMADKVIMVGDGKIYEKTKKREI